MPSCRCTSKQTKEQFAAKKIQKSSLTDQQAIDDVVREVQILKVLKGKPNNVEYFGAYEDDKEVVMVLECVPDSPRQHGPIVCCCSATCDACARVQVV